LAIVERNLDMGTLSSNLSVEDEAAETGTAEWASFVIFVSILPSNDLSR